jgi:hypothetical protein
MLRHTTSVAAKALGAGLISAARSTILASMITAETDASVDHPAHYGGEDDPYETIKVIEAMGDGPAFCRGNAIKYLMRHDKKGTLLQDLRKARWYVNRMIEQLEGGDP